MHRGCTSLLLKSFRDLGASGDLNYAGRAVWSPFLCFFFCCFPPFWNNSPSTFLRILQYCCFALKPHKCFADYKTSPDFPSQGWMDNYRIWLNHFLGGIVFPMGQESCQGHPGVHSGAAGVGANKLLKTALLDLMRCLVQQFDLKSRP